MVVLYPLICQVAPDLSYSCFALILGHRIMFWTDWGGPAKIERANMDGTQRSAVIFTNIKWPNGLTIDYTDSKLYWTEAILDLIECANFYGNERRQVLRNLQHPFGLDVYGEYIFWGDWLTKDIRRANKTTGEGVTIIKEGVENIMEMRVFHAGRQKGMSW